MASCWLTTALCSSVFHGEQPGRLVLVDLGQRHAGHLVDDFADHLLIDHAVDLLGLLAPFADDRFLAFLELVRLVPKLGGLFEVLLGNGGFLLLVELLDLGVDLLEVGRPGHGLETNAAPASSMTSMALSGKQRPLM